MIFISVYLFIFIFFLENKSSLGFKITSKYIQHTLNRIVKTTSTYATTETELEKNDSEQADSKPKPKVPGRSIIEH